MSVVRSLSPAVRARLRSRLVFSSSSVLAAARRSRLAAWPLEAEARRLRRPGSDFRPEPPSALAALLAASGFWAALAGLAVGLLVAGLEALALLL